MSWKPALLAAACALHSAAAVADEKNGCTVIDRLPYAIQASGNYCLESDLTAEHNGIRINADDVTIDLRGYVLRGSGTPDGDSSCIWGAGRSRITVRNGAVRDCRYGIYLSDSADTAEAGGAGFTGGYHRLEDLRISRCTFRGIRVEGNANLVRRVDVRFIGGDNFHGASAAVAIESLGPGARIVGNTVHEVRGSGEEDAAPGAAIALARMASGSIVEDNAVSNSGLEPGPPYATWPANSRATVGISVGGKTSGVIIEGNTVSNFRAGIRIAREAAVLVVRNTVSGAVVPFEMHAVAGGAAGYDGGNVCDQESCVPLDPAARRGAGGS
jgi:nitrous oxidase accessory protein NosD